MTELSTINSGKTVVFYSPLDGKDILVRSGVPQKENGLYHSVLLATSGEYIREDEPGRNRLVSKLKSYVKQKLTPKKKKSKTPKKEAVSNYSSSCLEIIRNLYENSTSDSEQFLKELLPFRMFERVLVPFSLKNSKSKADFDSHLSSASFNILDRELKKIGWDPKDEKLEKNRKLIETRLSLILEKASLGEKESERKSERKSEDENEEENFETVIRILSKKINRNIYFLDSSSRLPFKIFDSEKALKKSIIVLCLNSGYEIVGKLLEKNKVQRDFDSNSSLIQKIRTILYDKKAVARKYPELEDCMEKSKSRSRSSSNKNLTSRFSSRSSSRSRSASRSKRKTRSISSSRSPSRSKRKSRSRSSSSSASSSKSE